MVFAINEHELATGIHVSPHPEPLSPPYPSRLSQSTGFVCPALCIKLALVIWFIYGNLHISMLFSKVPLVILTLGPCLDQILMNCLFSWVWVTCFFLFSCHISFYIWILTIKQEIEVNNIYTQGRVHSFCQASNMKNWVNLIYDLVQGFRIFILVRQGTWVPGGFVSVLLLCLQPSWDPACLHLRGMSLGSLASLPAKISHCFVPSEDLMYLKISIQFFLCCLQTSRNLLCLHLRKNPFQLPCPSLSHRLSLLLLCVQPGELKVFGRAVLSQYFCTS